MIYRRVVEAAIGERGSGDDDDISDDGADRFYGILDDDCYIDFHRFLRPTLCYETKPPTTPPVLKTVMSIMVVVTTPHPHFKIKLKDFH